MKRIIGFFTILFLVLAFAETGFGADQEMMKKQTNMMSKQPTMQKQRKKVKNRKAKNYYKRKKVIKKSTIN